jgi:chemotaxis protein methyltransferase CheR
MKIQQEDFEYLQSLVAEVSAIVLHNDKKYLVETRLAPIAKRAELMSLKHLVDHLRSSRNGPMLQEVIDAMTTNETSFFRDDVPFQIMRDQVLPELIKKREPYRTIRVWSAGCSSGQEPYSLAMLWREHYHPLSGWRFNITATDLSQSMLAKARAGRYSELEVSRGTSPALRNQYFKRVGNDWQVDPSLTAMIDFRHLNLILPWPTLPVMDVIFLRNVLVYFDLSAKQRILNKIRQVLQPDGYLFLGGAETTLMVDDSFERVPHASGSYYRLRK